jgi:hypothetical protein
MAKMLHAAYLAAIKALRDNATLDFGLMLEFGELDGDSEYAAARELLDNEKFPADDETVIGAKAALDAMVAGNVEDPPPPKTEGDK